jgi:hypothetical protein
MGWPQRLAPKLFPSEEILLGFTSCKHARGGMGFVPDRLAADDIEEACHLRLSKNKIHLERVSVHEHGKQLAGVVVATGGRPPISA